MLSLQPDSYFTEEQFCQRFHVSGRTAQRWRVTGDGPKWVRLGLRRIGYRLSDCEAWAAARTFAHRAEELSRPSADPERSSAIERRDALKARIASNRPDETSRAAA